MILYELIDHSDHLYFGMVTIREFLDSVNQPAIQ